MDRMIYVAMTGAKHTLGQQAALSHNLANAGTVGYRAGHSVLRAVPVFSDTLATRAFVVDSSAGADLRPGAMQQTGRELDVAVQGPGWIAVQLEDGSEAYTRDGSLHVNPNGLLQTRSGLNVRGDLGTLSIPPNTLVTVAADGTLSTVPAGAGTSEPNISATLGRIKLVNPPEAQLVRGPDGLFRLAGGGEAEADAEVRLGSGMLEGSNVNVVEALVDMIALSRQFEAHMKLLQNAEGNAQRASQLLSLNA
ncbi:flagellar basal body rod protein FlgF [Nitrosovibrio sp. Nv17]|uniref:flagellar basal body rod protein FlgF n=1 Tax=Nitrosovibrio sp. Nv17 TaxID=1855339 RepID=UPI000908DF5A|nr:flagellar basal body rod protein FlgF [Nitrosovibrio sp. Nv17]SFW14692.1 flagellar basal-body rod protein FlgF [Nitrosovibrio sp. Nv17]